MADDSGDLEPASEDADEKHKEHLKLAAVIKGVHAKLRQTFRDTGDFSTTWNTHCRDQEVLSTYASAMHHLAVDHWTARPETRIHWCRDTCREYFLQGGLDKVLAKDERAKSHKIHRNSDSSQSEDAGRDQCYKSPSITDCHLAFTLEDVGVSACVPGGGHFERYISEDLTLPHSPPVRYPGCPAGYGVVGGSVASLAPSTARPHVLVWGESRDPCDAVTSSPSTPESGPGAFCPREARQQNPLEKCEDFVTRLDMETPSPQPEEVGMSLSENEAVSTKYGQVEYNSIALPFQGRIRLLDVGSCFNPFLEFKEFIAIGIDISPAVESVFHCDLLHLEVTKPLQVARDTMDTILTTLQGPSITKLPSDSFHVVVFSLLLEYFPCPFQRWLCCQKAHTLLMLNGLLLIITPDSGHQNKNAAQMKSWKRALTSLGFRRWRYVKQEHLHCMAFRKVGAGTEQSLLATDSARPDMMYIPQDLTNTSGGAGFLEDTLAEDLFFRMTRTDEEVELIRAGFNELPDIE